MHNQNREIRNHLVLEKKNPRDLMMIVKTKELIVSEIFQRLIYRSHLHLQEGSQISRSQSIKLIWVFSELMKDHLADLRKAQIKLDKILKNKLKERNLIHSKSMSHIALNFLNIVKAHKYLRTLKIQEIK